MLTGLFPHNHGEIKNETNHKYDKELYLTTLANAGYKNFITENGTQGEELLLIFKAKVLAVLLMEIHISRRNIKSILKKIIFHIFK